MLVFLQHGGVLGWRGCGNESFWCLSFILNSTRLPFLLYFNQKKENQARKYLAPATTGEREVMYFWSPTMERPRKKVALDSYHDSTYSKSFDSSHS